MVILHYYSMASFLLLLLSGVALFWEPVHTALIPYLATIYDLHIFFGLVFAVTLLTPLFVKWPPSKLIRRLDWLFPLLFGTFIVLTGILVWKLNWFPTTWRSVSFRWHGDISYVLAIWLILHGVYKAIGYRPVDDGVNPRMNPERRLFLKWAGLGVLGTMVITVLDPIEWIRQMLTSSGSGVSSTASGETGFAAYYTVIRGYPNVNLETYQLRIDGLVSHPASLSWKEVLALSNTEETVDFHCVTGWSVPGVQWEGVRIQSIVDRVKPSGSVKFVHFYSADGVYTESLSLGEALDSTVLLAYRLNGKPLDVKQGYPIRLVVPKMYGYKSIKWVNRVEFSDKPLTGYWEERGYPNEAYLGRGI